MLQDFTTGVAQFGTAMVDIVETCVDDDGEKIIQ